MATATARVRNINRAAKTKKPVKGANFASKRERKIQRKELIAGYLSNVVSDVQVGFKQRQEFYRRLRVMKLKRRQIAKEFAYLAAMVEALPTEVRRIEARYKDVHYSYVEESVQLAKEAAASTGAAASEMHAFSRARIYYAEELAA